MKQFKESGSLDIEKLNLFSLPLTQDSIEKVQWIEYRPQNQITDGSALDFMIGGNGNEYIDLDKSKMLVKFKVVKIVAGVETAIHQTTDQIGIVNNVLDSLWYQVDTFLNQQLVSSQTNFHQHKSYLKLITSESDERLNNMDGRGFKKDTEGTAMDSTDIFGLNGGLGSRVGAFINTTNPGVVYGGLKTDLGDMKKLIVNGVDVQMRFWPGSAEFLLVKQASITADLRVKILDARLDVCKVTPRPEVLVAQNQMLYKQPALYPYTRTRLHTFNVKTGTAFVSEDDIFNGEVPQRVYIGFVSDTAFKGSLTKNPFYF